MQEPTKKLPTDDDLITIRFRVHRNNATRIKEYVRIIESEKETNYTVAEVFPEYIGKEQQIALRVYRHREDLTQRQLAELVGIPQRHVSEMENGKRTIGKEMAKRLSKILSTGYKTFL